MKLCVNVTKKAHVILLDRWENDEAIEVLDKARQITEICDTSKIFIRSQVLNHTAKAHSPLVPGPVPHASVHMEHENASERIRLTSNLPRPSWRSPQIYNWGYDDLRNSKTALRRDQPSLRHVSKRCSSV